MGRGALKLLGVLDPLGVSADGRVCADLGASTGGFTQVLLDRGATRVYAVDVGRGQLDWSLRNDPRVVVMEGVNARYLEALQEPIDLVVADLSFISLTLVLPAIATLIRPGGEALVLVKPQFEAGRAAVEKGGVVRDPELREAAVERVRKAALSVGFTVVGECDSPIPGAKAGNIERFVFLRDKE